MAHVFTENERLLYLVSMLGGWERLFFRVYTDSSGQTRERLLNAAADLMGELEPAMDALGIPKTPEGVARAMMMTEDIIGCEPAGELLSASPTEAVRKVTSCPFIGTITGDFCRFQMAALEKGLGDRHGLEITCTQTMAEGADHCIWKVKRKA
jgi:hypothetical protein